jgi:hypothetical protein
MHDFKSRLKEMFANLTQGNDMDKKIKLAIVLIISIVFSAVASAHIINGSLGAGTTNSPAVDIYRLTCFAYPAGGAPAGEVSGNSTRARISYQGSGTNIHRVSIVRQTPTTVGIASVTAETNGINNSVTLNGTNGDFYLIVSRTANTNLTASTYSLIYHCENAAGQYTGTTEDLDLLDPSRFIQDR